MGKKRFELGDLIIELSDKVCITDSEANIYHSLNNSFLTSYENAIIQATAFDKDESLEGLKKSYPSNYRRFLGLRRIHLGTLAESGFMNSNYDITFCFDIKFILSQENAQVCDHDLLGRLLLYCDTSINVGEVFKSKKDYELGDEILLNSLDLKKARHIFVYSPEAKKRVAENNLFNSTNLIDMSEFRKEAIKLYFK